MKLIRDSRQGANIPHDMLLTGKGTMHGTMVRVFRVDKICLRRIQHAFVIIGVLLNVR